MRAFLVTLVLLTAAVHTAPPDRETDRAADCATGREEGNGIRCATRDEGNGI